MSGRPREGGARGSPRVGLGARVVPSRGGRGSEVAAEDHDRAWPTAPEGRTWSALGPRRPARASTHLGQVSASARGRSRLRGVSSACAGQLPGNDARLSSFRRLQPWRQCAGAARGVAAPGPAPAPAKFCERRERTLRLCPAWAGPVTPAPFSRPAKSLWLIRRLLVLPPNVARAPYTPRGRE